MRNQYRPVIDTAILCLLVFNLLYMFFGNLITGNSVNDLRVELKQGIKTRHLTVEDGILMKGIYESRGFSLNDTYLYFFSDKYSFTFDVSQGLFHVSQEGEGQGGITLGRVKTSDRQGNETTSAIGVVTTFDDKGGITGRLPAR